MSKKRKKKAEDSEFWAKVAIAAIAAGTGATTSEAIKAATSKPAAPPVVVVIERERLSTPERPDLRFAFPSHDQSSGDPPSISGCYALKDQQQKVIYERDLSLPVNVFSDLFLQAARSTPETSPDASNAIRLDFNENSQFRYGFWIDRDSLNAAYRSHFIDDQPALDLSQVSSVTLDLSNAAVYNPSGRSDAYIEALLVGQTQEQQKAMLTEAGWTKEQQEAFFSRTSKTKDK